MSVHEDVIDFIVGQVTHIGLSDDGALEYAGGAYAKLVPTYPAAAAGSSDLSATLQFDGAINDGPITHLIFFRTAELWVIRLLDAPVSFNSDGRLDITNAPITSAFPA